MLSDLFLKYPFVKSVIEFLGFDTDYSHTIDFELDTLKVKRIIEGKELFSLWVNQSEITKYSKGIGAQLDLLGHSETLILIIKIETWPSHFIFILKDHTELTDVIYEKDQRFLIELCLKNELLNYVNSNLLLKTDQLDYIQVCKNQSISLLDLNKKFILLETEFNSFLLSLTSYFLKNEISDGIELELSEPVNLYLRRSNKSFSELELEIKQAFSIAASLSPSPTLVTLELYYFTQREPNALPISIQTKRNEQIVEKKINKKREVSVPIANSPITNNLSKTIFLLDRYELAVTLLNENKLPIMGKNIANACAPKISAPALTDSINKHKDRIVLCLKQQPDLWPMLRTHYQPIQKLNQSI